MTLLHLIQSNPLLAIAAWLLLAGWVMDFLATECGHYRSDV